MMAAPDGPILQYFNMDLNRCNLKCIFTSPILISLLQLPRADQWDDDDPHQDLPWSSRSPGTPF